MPYFWEDQLHTICGTSDSKESTDWVLCLARRVEWISGVEQCGLLRFHCATSGSLQGVLSVLRKNRVVLRDNSFICYLVICLQSFHLQVCPEVALLNRQVYTTKVVNSELSYPSSRTGLDVDVLLYFAAAAKFALFHQFDLEETEEKKEHEDRRDQEDQEEKEKKVQTDQEDHEDQENQEDHDDQ